MPRLLLFMKLMAAAWAVARLDCDGDTRLPTTAQMALTLYE